MKALLSIACVLAVLHTDAQTISRLRAQALHINGGTSFYTADSTEYTYTSTKRGGDLDSRYIAYDRSLTVRWDKALSKFGNYAQSRQNFNTNNFRTVQINAQWNTVIGVWQDAETNYYYPDAADSLTSEVDQVWNATGAFWQDHSRRFTSFNAAHYRTNYSLEQFDGTAWSGIEKFAYSYDSKNNLIGRTLQVWDAGSWINNYHDTNFYTAADQISLNIGMLWDKTTSTWKNFKQINYKYNGAGLLDTQTEAGWDATALAWAAAQRFTYGYDGSGNMLRYTTENFDKTTAAWVPFKQRVYTYNLANEMLSNVQQFWDGSAWQNSDRADYSYDAAGNENSESTALWDGSVWNNNERTEDTYNANRQLTSRVYLKWNGAASMWDVYAESQKLYYYYETVTNGINENKLANINVRIFPQPTSDMMFVEADKKSSSPCNLILRDVQGKTVYENVYKTAGALKAGINVSALPSGTYFLELSDNEGMQFGRSIQVQR